MMARQKVGEMSRGPIVNLGWLSAAPAEWGYVIKCVLWRTGTLFLSNRSNMGGARDESQYI